MLRFLYCIASNTCLGCMSLLASMSAIVLETFKILVYPLALILNLLNACCKISSPFESNLQYLSTLFPVNCEFVTIPKSLYLSS